MLLDLRPEVASFTFGLPSAEECKRLRDAGIATVGTVTSVYEADAAADCGVDAIAVQGPSAGGHRGTFDPVAEPNPQPLPELLAAAVARVERAGHRGRRPDDRRRRQPRDRGRAP